MSVRQNMFNRITQDLAPGKLEWIGLRRERRGQVDVVSQVCAIESLGLEGDRRCHGTPGSARQVTLISLEHIEVVAKLLGKDIIEPATLRRNLVVSGININALRHQRFTIGEALFEATAYCHPCSRMEEALGKGGHAAMLWHGGMCAKIMKSGQITIGDTVQKVDL
ncbi:MOSC domain-containing protein [Agarilytica rhodophyticola]|uniref:MOSC domain-containing protein n=1 Tax=Agarilytica rhodophyticola TaxID=1737490 RepID=UPI000B3419E6|nr:MOSC domain-containing protein [Agarilytica rhodophyticola]